MVKSKKSTKEILKKKLSLMKNKALKKRKNNSLGNDKNNQIQKEFENEEELVITENYKKPLTVNDLEKSEGMKPDYDKSILFI